MPDVVLYPEWMPSVDQLASLMSARTLGGELGMSELGVFDTTTRPTASQAQQALLDSADIVIPEVGDVDGRAGRLAAQAVLRRAAATVESTYMPEQAAQAQSSYQLYMAEYRELLKSAVSAAAEVDALGSSDAGDGGSAVGSFEDDPCDVSWMNRVM